MALADNTLYGGLIFRGFVPSSGDCARLCTTIGLVSPDADEPAHASKEALCRTAPEKRYHRGALVARYFARHTALLLERLFMQAIVNGES